MPTVRTEQELTEPAAAPPPLPKSGIKGKVISLLVLLAAAGGVWALAELVPTPSREAPPTDAPPVNVSVETVELLGALPDTFELPGVVEPNKVVKLSAEVAGRVERIAVDEGKAVRAGDRLMEINDELLAADVAQAQAQAAYDKTEFERVAALKERDFARQGEYDQAKTKAQVSEALLQAAQRRLARATISAPMSGVLNGVPVEVGEYVMPGSPLAEIVDARTVKIVASVPERDVAALKLGDLEAIHVDAMNGEFTVSGTVTYISQLADVNTRTARVEVSADNASGSLRSGQIVRVVLARGVMKDVMLIPLRAVVPLENGKEVYVVSDGKALRRRVTIGRFRGDRVEIVRAGSELQSGDELILVPSLVGPGQPVIVRERLKAPLPADNGNGGGAS